MTERSTYTSPYGLEGEDPGMVGVPEYTHPDLPPPPYSLGVDQKVTSDKQAAPVDPREDCDQTTITPSQGRKKPKRGRERTGHGFAI